MVQIVIFAGFPIHSVRSCSPVIITCGSDIERDDLVYGVNEWDSYAVEEAI